MSNTLYEVNLTPLELYYRVLSKTHRFRYKYIYSYVFLLMVIVIALLIAIYTQYSEDHSNNDIRKIIVFDKGF